MSSELGAVSASFGKVDNTAVVDFLTSIAGVLVAENLITSKESDNLRLALSGIQTDVHARSEPVLLQLINQNAEFLGIATAYLGASGFSLNLLRHTIRPILSDTTVILSQWGQDLLAKSELLFNRPFTVFGANGRPERQTLYSRILVDLSAALSQACDRVHDLRQRFSSFRATGLPGLDGNLETQWSEALGFQGQSDSFLPQLEEALLKQQLSQVLIEIAAITNEFFEQSLLNFAQEKTFQVSVCCDQLLASAERLNGLRFQKAATLATWETRRLSLLSSVCDVNDALRDLARESILLLSSASAKPQTTTKDIPLSIQRRLVTDLICAALAPAKATEAAAALAAYCREKNLEPRQVLVSELPLIHQALLPRTLELLQALVAAAPGLQSGADEKQEILGRGKALTLKFKQTLSAAGATSILFMLCCLLATSGCGLKTDVKSDVVDYRPEIPFRELPAETPKAAPSMPAADQAPLKK